ncbi:MAG: hypothetical protein IJA58_00095 [Lachnospiraceae bacterium]|nr:hypothetical protein [Lachnospiraceae bacterium]
MRKHLSVMMLAARFTIYKVLGLLMVMSGVQVAVFLGVMSGGPEKKLNALLSDSHPEWIAMAGFIVLCIVLCGRGKGFGGTKSVYTLRRLSVSEVTVTGWWALQNSLMYLLFWLWEALTMLVLCLIYVYRAAELAFGPQTVFMAWYEVDYLHRLIPLADASGWIRNVVQVLGLGICSAAFGYHERHRRRGMAIWFMAIVTVVGFSDLLGGGNDSDVMTTLWGLVVAGLAVGMLVYRERRLEEEEK